MSIRGFFDAMRRWLSRPVTLAFEGSDFHTRVNSLASAPWSRFVALDAPPPGSLAASFRSGTPIRTESRDSVEWNFFEEVVARKPRTLR